MRLRHETGRDVYDRLMRGNAQARQIMAGNSPLQKEVEAAATRFFADIMKDAGVQHVEVVVVHGGGTERFSATQRPKAAPTKEKDMGVVEVVNAPNNLLPGPL